MYVHIVSFLVKKGEEITFVELQKFEENMEAKPAGLDHYHIYKDRNNAGHYYLIEYWNTKEDRDNLEKTESYKKFHELRKLALETKCETIECDMEV